MWGVVLRPWHGVVVALNAGYGFVVKTLHWVMFAALGAQFVVGYSLERAEDLFDSDRLVVDESLATHPAFGHPVPGLGRSAAACTRGISC